MQEQRMGKAGLFELIEDRRLLKRSRDGNKIRTTQTGFKTVGLERLIKEAGTTNFEEVLGVTLEAGGIQQDQHRECGM